MVEPATFWCELAWLGGDATTKGVTLEIVGDRIAEVRTGQPEPPGATRLAGLTLPAFANAHSHAFHRALRGRTHGGQGNFWTWRELMYQVAARLDPDHYYELGRAVYAEMLVAGIGVVGEFHYVHHQPDGTPYERANAMGEALTAAATDVGLRITLLDTLYLHGGFGSGGAAQQYAPAHPEQRRFSDGSADTWMERVTSLAAHDGPSVRVGGAVHSVRAVDPAAMTAAAKWAASYDAPLHIHVSEQPAENERCIQHFDATPIALLDDSGALGPNTTLVHATHLTDNDIDRVARSGAVVCFCPTTERDLADGIGPSRLLAEHDIALCLGSDSHAIIDMFEEARALELNQRLATLERGTHSPAALAATATTTGYKALGWTDGGSLVEGALADFTSVAIDSVRTAGTDAAHGLDSVLFAAGTADVHHVVVAGQVVVANGKHTRIDVAPALTAAIQKVISE